MEETIIRKLKTFNIIFPLRGDMVGLAIKTRKIGVGLYNGYGGKVESDQSMLESCVEEFDQEAGIRLQEKDFEKVGIMDFYKHYDNNSADLLRCEIFVVRNLEPELKETEEMANPTWFPISKIPFEKMIIGDDLWIGRILSGEKLLGEIHFNQDMTKIIEPAKIQTVLEL